MSYDKFNIIKATAVPLPVENIDTDQIIPARFLKAIERKGFGENLFRDWRYDENNEIVVDFPLNNTEFANSKILITGKNFGSGSSREHAAWALYDYGFRVIVSSFFADIFKNNALNNGILPIVAPPNFIQKMLIEINRDSCTQFTVDLEKQKIIIDKTGNSAFFDINNYKKECLLSGLDEIDYLVSIKDEIELFEKSRL